MINVGLANQNNLAIVTEETLSKAKEALSKAVTTATGLVGYSLEKPAKQLVPFASPIRNRIPRKTSETGTSAHWKMITAIKGSSRFGVAEGTKANGITTVVEDALAAFKSFGRSDYVTYEAKAAAKNYMDIKAKSSTNLLSLVMTEEERMILGGNITALGVVAAPVATVSAGGSITAAEYSIKVAALTLEAANNIDLNQQIADLEIPAYGVTAASSAGTATTTTNNKTISATVTAKSGALAYAWFIGASGSETLQKVTTNNAISLTSLVTGGSAPPSSDTTGTALDYNGLIPQIIASGKFVDYANAKIKKSGGGGVDVLDAINSHMYTKWKYTPDVYYVSSQVHKDITDAIIAGNGAPTLLVDNTDKNQITGNYQVTRYICKSTGKTQRIETHPWLPDGTLLAMPESVPYQNSEIPSVLEIENGFDYMQIEYATTAPKEEFEIRQYGVLKNYWPGAMAFYCNIQSGVGT